MISSGGPLVDITQLDLGTFSSPAEYRRHSRLAMSKGRGCQNLVLSYDFALVGYRNKFPAEQFKHSTHHIPEF